MKTGTINRISRDDHSGRVRLRTRRGERTDRRDAAKRSVGRHGVITSVLPALASGLLIGIAYPPVSASWLVWVGLIPLLWAIRREQRLSRVFLMGTITGTVMFLFAFRPLVSAHEWSGWVSGAAELAALRSRQFVVLNALWVTLAVAGACFWGAFAVVLSRLSRGSLERMAIAAPPLFVLIPEWLRSVVGWSFHWAFVGNVASEIRSVRQLGALGGVWLISWLVVTVNVAILALVSRETRARRWMLPAVTTAIVTLVLLGGSWHAGRVRSRLAGADGLRVGALQLHEAKYTFAHFTRLGFEKGYLEVMRQVAQGKAGKLQLLVLPESIALTTMSVDGTRTAAKPESVQRSADAWTETIRSAIADSDAHFAVVLGVDTVERGALHNSLAFWTRSGLQAWYHKQRLVPFAEYRPAVLGWFGMSGPAKFEPGDASRLATINGVTVGGFICQEILYPGVTRRSTREGAQILVSGGNDGVFADPAVAEVHADLARLRAVETGRYIIRAMKTGVSAIIDPTGEEISRSKSAAPILLTNRVIPLDALTPYVRFGDWPLAAAALVVLGVGVIWLREERVLRQEAGSDEAGRVEPARSA